MIVNDSYLPAQVSWALVGHTGLEFFFPQPLAEEKAKISAPPHKSTNISFGINVILACFKRIHGDVTGSTLLQWHQCCLPTKIPARTTVRWFFVCSLGHNWSSMSSVQHFCHPVPNSWSRISASTPVWEPWGMAAARSLLVSGSGSGNVHYWHSGEGGGAKPWDLALLGRAAGGMSFPCYGEVQKSCRNSRIPWAQVRGCVEASPMTQDPARSCLSQAAASRAQILNRIHKNLHRKPRFVTPLSLGACHCLDGHCAPKRAMASLLNLVSNLPWRGSAAWACPVPLLSAREYNTAEINRIKTFHFTGHLPSPPHFHCILPSWFSPPGKNSFPRDNVQIHPFQHKAGNHMAERQNCGTLSHESFHLKLSNKEIACCDYLPEELTLKT